MQTIVPQNTRIFISTFFSLSMELFLPEKYPVIIGDGAHVGLCSCWTSLEILIGKHPKLKENFALLGTLYGREGISIILRNLALNPQIQHVLILADNPLSLTKFGITGWKHILKLWEAGLGNNHVIKDSSVQIHKEIDEEIIEILREKVKIIDASGWSIEKILQFPGSITQETPYMQPINFPPVQRGSEDKFVSEIIGWSVRAKSITAAWLKAVDRIMRYGEVKKTEYGNKQRELLSLTWVIEDECIEGPNIPSWPKEIKQTVGLEQEGIEEYTKSLLNDTVPQGTHYTYGSRLLSYKDHFSQLDHIIRKLKETNGTRRAYASITYPPQDFDNTSPPCLSLIHCAIQNDKVHMMATFRSHDIFKAAIPNAFALLGLLHHIAKKIEMPVGKLSITSNSAHIYEEEWVDAEKLLECQKWSSPEKSYTIEDNVDQRGNVSIRLVNEQINVELLSTSGISQMEWQGKNARSLIKKLAFLDLLSEPYHYADIAIELTKAEIALKTKQPYIQDKPFRFGDVVLV